MPKLWSRTIESHRREVRDAIVETTAALVSERGMLSVTMSQIAEETGIGRATLYKYFTDVEAILLAWHTRRIAEHLAHLVDVRDRASGASERLASVLEAYAVIVHDVADHREDLTAFVHRGQELARAQDRLHAMIRDLIGDAALNGDVRSDISPDELAAYCLNAVGAARDLRSKAAVRRLVSLTMDALQPH